MNKKNKEGSKTFYTDIVSNPLQKNNPNNKEISSFFNAPLFTHSELTSSSHYSGSNSEFYHFYLVHKVC